MSQTTQSVDLAEWAKTANLNKIKGEGIDVTEEWVKGYGKDLKVYDPTDHSNGCYRFHLGDEVIDFYPKNWFKTLCKNHQPMDELATILLLLPTYEARCLYLDSL